jgi:N-acetylglucosaminyl-diphospho-decaprenol L-rhamnosyltransferase
MTGPRSDLAVVIVNYNAGAYLTRCVASVLQNAGGLDLDVLVVDNASHDGSAQVAKTAQPDVRVTMNATNRGLSAAWNQGAEDTDSAWILFLNPDAELWTGTLAGFVKVGEEHPDVAVLGPVVRNADGTIYESGRVFPSVPTAVGHAFLGAFRPDNPSTRAYRQTDWDRLSEREVDWVSGACMLVRRDAFEQVGRFDEDFFLYAEELDLMTRLRDAGWRVLYTPELEILHEGAVSTGRSARMHRMHSASIYRYYRKHRSSGWRRVTLPFAWLALRARAELVSLRDRVRAR